MAKKIPNKLKRIRPQREIDTWGTDSMAWRNHLGQYHRVNGPAFTNSRGVRAWYLNGRRHRLDGPAVIWPSGREEWCVDDVWHRTGGPAFTNSCGARRWYLNGRQHRLDGPAVIWPNGREEWCVDDVWHRTDGPAICHPDGTQDWYFNGEYMTPQIEEWMTLRQVTWPWDESTQAEFSLTWT